MAAGPVRVIDRYTPVNFLLHRATINTSSALIPAPLASTSLTHLLYRTKAAEESKMIK